MNEKVIKTQQLYALLDWEPFVILTTLIVLAWMFYKFFLRDVSQERHFNLRSHFKNLTSHYLFLLTVFASFLVIQNVPLDSSFLRSLP